MASADYQLPNIPFEQLRRHACLELACKWFAPDPSDTEVASGEIVKAAAAFETFVKGCESDEQPPEPKKADAPKPILAWVARDKDDSEGLDIFALRPPDKAYCSDGSEIFISGDGGDQIAWAVDPELLGFDLDPGEVVEITIRKV